MKKRKLTTEEFIRKAKIINGNKYDYSNVNYINAHTKVEILCPLHGSFWQVPYNHLNKQQCPKCANIKRNKTRFYTKEKFINNANKVHNYKYDYSKINFINISEKIEIMCPVHGSFWQHPYSHLQGYGCSKCGNISQANKKFLTQKEFINRATNIHKNKYDYSGIVYKGYNTKIKIKCPIHGYFYQTPDAHLHNQGCPKCGLESKRILLKDFINKCNKIHNNKYDYSKIRYKSVKDKIEIVCPKHGSFFQRPDIHLSGHGCPLCKQSKGEIIIETFLKERDIDFIYQYKIKNCKNKRMLPFDFAIFDKNKNLKCLIEFQGLQHYTPVECFGGNKGLLKTKHNDNIKYRYCKNNKIILHYINYNENIIDKLHIILGV